MRHTPIKPRYLCKNKRGSFSCLLPLFILCPALLLSTQIADASECHTLQILGADGTSRTWKLCGHIEPVDGSIDPNAIKGETIEESASLTPGPQQSLAGVDFAYHFGTPAPALRNLGARIDEARIRADVYSLTDLALLLHHYEELSETTAPAQTAEQLLSEAAALALQRKQNKSDPMALEAITVAIARIGAAGASTAFIERYGPQVPAETSAPDEDQVMGFAAKSESNAYTEQIERRRTQVKTSHLSRKRKTRAMNQVDSVADYLDNDNPKPDIAKEVLHQLRAWIRSGANPGSLRLKKIQTIIDPGSGFGFADDATATMPFAAPAFVELVNNTGHSLHIQIDGEYYDQIFPSAREAFMVPSGETHIKVFQVETGTAVSHKDLNQYDTYRYTINP